VRRLPVVIAVSLLLVSPLAARGRRGDPPPVDPELAKVVDPLVTALDDASYEVRERATLELMKMGPTARPAVLPARDHRSPEVRLRVRRILLHYSELDRLSAVGMPKEGDWPMLKRGPGRGASSGGLAIRARPELVWHRTLPQEIGLPYFDSPLLATPKHLFVVSRRGLVVCVSRVDGELLWAKETGEPAFAGPVLSGDLLFVPGRSLTAVDAATGRVRWRWPTDYGVTASPLVHGGRVYAVEKGEYLASLDAATGEEIWKVRTRATTSAPVVVGDLVILGTREGVKAFQVSNGTRRWTFKTSSPVVTTPAILADRVVVGDDARGVYAITTEKGREIWRRRIPDGRLLETPVVYGNAVIFSTGGATIRAFRGSDGADLWSRFLGSFIQSSPSTVGGLAYFASGPFVGAMECANGDDVWRLGLSGAFSSPIVMDGTLYLVSLDGELLAYR